MKLIKLPVPGPSVVWLELISGFAVVDQQTPWAVTGASPAEVTVPPEVAVLEVIEVVVVVVIVGGLTKVVS
jgi:hypothetical protein